MLSQSSRCVSGLLNCQSLQTYRKAASFSGLRRCDVLVRFQNTASTSSDQPRSNARPYRHKSNHRNRSIKRNKTKKVDLGVSSLGKPGEVVLVHEQTRHRGFPKTSSHHDRKDKSALPFMLEEIEKEAAPYGNAVVIEQIESFRLSHQPGNKLTANDWEDLRTALRSSFTIRQLSDYISGYESNDSVSGGSVRRDTEKWRPGTSVFFETSLASQPGVADRVATSQDLKGKDVLAEKILRDCWQLGVMNEIGQIDIRLPTYSLALLLGSEHFSFEELASLHEAKIDVTHSLGLVRITGKQRSSESICEIIHDTTKRIRDEGIELFATGDEKAKSIGKTLNSDFLAWVSNTYGVAFKQNTSYGPSRIFYLLENKLDADDARRALNLAAHSAISSPVPFSTYMSSSDVADRHNVEPGKNVSWLDRQKAWFRWGVPSTQPDKAKDLNRFFFDKHQTRLSDELLKLLRQASSVDITHRGISEVHESITAAVGRCLFLRKPFAQEEPVSASQLGKMSLPRTFITEIPRSAHFLRMLTPHFSEEQLRSHRIRLVPSGLHASIFPQLELDVAVKPSELGDTGFDCDLRSAKAILEESHVDYLLPEATLDLRFTRKLTRDILTGPWENYSLDGLQNDLRDCFNRSMTSDGDIPLPAFTSVTLPNALLSPASEAQHLDGCTTGEYIILPANDIQGTRIHKYEFQDQRLYYSFYESGPFNPQTTTNLFLEMDMGGNDFAKNSSEAGAESEPSSSPLQREFNSFYTTACALAFEASSA